MKAAVYYETGPPDVLQYEEVPDPQCHPNGVLIDVKAVSIEGGDILNRAGAPMASRPHIVGYQCAGIIREAGSNVTDRSVGQRVVAAAGPCSGYFWFNGDRQLPVRSNVACGITRQPRLVSPVVVHDVDLVVAVPVALERDLGPIG
jgi:NADPH:quinone reductase-like Zn-dependent oxidoreductase